MTDTNRSEQGFLHMVLAPLKLLAHIYLEVLGDDIKKESTRCINAALMLCIGFFFVFNTILIVNALGVFLLNTYLNNWFWSLLSILGLQLVFSLIFVLVAKSTLSGPFFTKTRKMASKAYQEFR